MHQATLLVVEDQQDYLKLLELMLSQEGFLVAPVQDGAQAINLLTICAKPDPDRFDDAQCEW
ncbi:MAG TPA: hypothetical protein VEF04_16835 [Blastocatellia bacterium]|nr:hypothetical protein [Blastocatellia bacterium]